MIIENILTDKLSLRIWSRFFEQVNRILRQVPKDQRDEIVLELQGHILESIQHDDADSEPDRIMNALDKLGNPEEFLRPLVAEKLLTSGARSLKPSALFCGLYYNMFASARHVLLSLVFAAGYVILAILLFASVMKLFVPEFGLYIHNDGGFTLGTTAEEIRNVSTEVLGMWLVPLGIASAAVLYIALTKLLGALMKKT